MDALQQFQTKVEQYVPDMTTILGPKYDYSSEIKTPGDIGVHFGDGSWNGITGAIAGVNYYTDTIGFGESTGLAKAKQEKLAPARDFAQHPLGVRYFIKSGATCSNGQDMYQYLDTIPHGLPGRLGAEIESTLHAKLRGLAPGMFEDAAKALNPMPMFNAVMNSGYARCYKKTLPIGDIEGNIQSPITGEVWIDTNKENVIYVNGKPHASHWIFESWVTAEQYAKDKKVEGFRSSGVGQSKVLAGALFAALFIGLVTFTARK